MVVKTIKGGFRIQNFLNILNSDILFIVKNEVFLEGIRGGDSAIKKCNKMQTVYFKKMGKHTIRSYPPNPL